MASPSRRLCALLLASALLAAPGFAEDEAEVPAGLGGAELEQQARGWLADLQAASFSARERARRSLKHYAADLETLLTAALESADPEVSRTCRELLEGAGVLPPTEPPSDAAPPGDVAALGQVTWSVRDVPAAEAFRRFGAAHGGSFELPLTHRARPLTVSLDDAPYFAALADLLTAADLAMPKPFARGGVATLEPRAPVAADAPPPAPWTAAGPLRVRVAEVVTKRVLGVRVPPSFVLKLDVWWAPSVQVNQLTLPRLVEGEDDEGNAYAAASKGNASYGLATGTYARTLDVPLRPAADAVGAVLASAAFDLPLRLRHGLATVALDDLATLPADRRLDQADDPAAPEDAAEPNDPAETDAAEPDAAEPDAAEPDASVTPGAQDTPSETEVATAGADREGTVSFRSLEQQPADSGNWVAEIVAHLSGDLARQTAQMTLLRADGKHQAMQVGGGRTQSADGTLHLTARAWRVGTERPLGLSLSWFRREASGTLRFTLKDVPLR